MDVKAEIPQGWHIELNPKPIPVRTLDYDFWHDDCDEDTLYGYAGSVEEAIEVIEQIADFQLKKNM